MIKPIETVYRGYRFRSRLEARWAVFFDSLGLEWVYEPEGFDLGLFGWYLPDFKVRFHPSADWSWFEVKPELPSPDELAKLTVLSTGELSMEGTPKPAVMLCGYPGRPRFPKRDGDMLTVGDSYVALEIVAGETTGSEVRRGTFVGALVCCFAKVGGGKDLDIWPMYVHIKGLEDYDSNPIYGSYDDLLEAAHAPSKATAGEVYGNPPRDVIGPGWYGALELYHDNFRHRRYYDGPGVKYLTSDLAIAYTAARSARFEHGETPNTIVD